MIEFLPNAITTSRIFLAMAFVPFFLRGDFFSSLVVFSAAAITDFFDGYVARKFYVVSKSGAMLDPLADKVLMFVSYLLFAHENVIHWYTAAVVILRDVFIVAVVCICLIKKIELKFSPLMSSKISTTVQLVFVISVLACKAFNMDLSLDVFEWIVLGMTVYSGVNYARKYVWLKSELRS